MGRGGVRWGAGGCAFMGAASPIRLMGLVTAIFVGGSERAPNCEIRGAREADFWHDGGSGKIFIIFCVSCGVLTKRRNLFSWRISLMGSAPLRQSWRRNVRIDPKM